MPVSPSRQCGAPQDWIRPCRGFGKARSEHVLIANITERLCAKSYYPAIHNSDMSFSTRQDDESAHDLHALALSTSQLQACILGCHQLFSKRKESHLLKVTRFARDASHTPSTQSFTSSSQLSAYFDNNPNDADGQSSDLEI